MKSKQKNLFALLRGNLQLNLLRIIPIQKNFQN